MRGDPDEFLHHHARYHRRAHTRDIYTHVIWFLFVAIAVAVLTVVLINIFGH